MPRILEYKGVLELTKVSGSDADPEFAWVELNASNVWGEGNINRSLREQDRAKEGSTESVHFQVSYQSRCLELSLTGGLWRPHASKLPCWRREGIVLFIYQLPSVIGWRLLSEDMNPLAFLACPTEAKVNSMARESPQAKKCRCCQWMVNQWDMGGVSTALPTKEIIGHFWKFQQKSPRPHFPNQESRNANWFK